MNVSYRRCFLSLVSTFFLWGITVSAEVTLPALLADHMVVQRGMPVHAWGMAAPNDSITTTFRGETKSTAADEFGRWSLYLSPGEAGGPFQMAIKGSNTIVLNDVLVGDVWVASGQSNMEFPMRELANPEPELAAAQFPKIRIFQVEHRPSDYPRSDVEAKTWVLCNPESVREASAVGYYFVRDLYQRLNIPFGLIESYWSGTAAESWTSLHALSADASLMPVFATRLHMVEDQERMLLQQKNELRDYEKAAAEAKAEGKPAPNYPWHPDFAGWAPTALFNGMIAPLTRFPIRGVIWYQGESNSAERVPIYAQLFQTMIGDWRRAWAQGDFPFLFVQIANWDVSPEARWPEVRDAQRKALVLKNTGMAVIIDTSDGKDLHPKNKKDVGLRLALAARAIAYGEKIEWSGPLYRGITKEEHSLRVWFDHANGLAAKGDTLVGFEIAGSDGKYVVADAKIEGASVVVSNAQVPDPVSVRYAWASNPACNLYNREGLPASPFQAPE